MANEIFKEIKTRISLKILALSEWDAIKDTYKPLRGEVCICEIPTGNAEATTAPTVLFKVGDGEKVFSQLKWASALAADVYDWAKNQGANVFTKEGNGNVISGIVYDASLNNGKGGFKYTTASVATSEGLKDLQDEVAAVKKDIADNREAWVLDTDTRYSFSTDGDKLVVKKTLYTNGVAGTEEAVGTYEFLTAAEVAETLKGYYTKTEADGKFAPIDIDTGVHSVSLASGTNNGTVKLTVDGTATDNIKVTGLQDAAYTTVAALNATAKGYADAVEAKLPTSADYGVLSVANGDDTITIGGTTQNPTIAVTANKFDAHGAAAAVLGESTDGAAANTVYGAKAAAAAAQSDATIAKTKIETFLGTVTPDGSQDIIDTLTEINTYVGEHGEEFASLSGRVTNIENGTTVVPKATDADKLGGAVASDYLKKADAAAVKVTNATNADKAADADKLGGQLPSYYATKAVTDSISETIGNYVSDEMEHSNIVEYIEYQARKVDLDVENGSNMDYANLSQLAGGVKTIKDTISEYGNIVSEDSETFVKKSEAIGYDDILTKTAAQSTYQPKGDYATAAQGGKADSALQEITTTANNGLKVTNKNNIDIDTDVIFVLDCNW